MPLLMSDSVDVSRTIYPSIYLKSARVQYIINAIQKNMNIHGEKL